MRNSKQVRIRSSELFRHDEDAAFNLLDRLEELLARMVPSPGSRSLRERLHRISARLAEAIILLCDEDPRERSLAQHDPAQRLCRVIHGMLKLVRRYAVLNPSDHEDALKLATELMRLLVSRHLGVEVIVEEAPMATASDSAQTAAGELDGNALAVDAPRKKLADA